MSFSQELPNAIRFLSIDAVEKAQSGHPGMPLGMADIATVLWMSFLKHSPQNPNWFNRDRFVLSNGHGSMLLYSLLHLTGYNLSIEEIKNFRQLHSKTPGHPEFGETPGVETTTGPLGQGLANAVGMAIAEKTLAATFNKKELPALVDHYTYCFVGDGCLMEGISHEVCSLAGTLGLNKLIVCYDSNGISIDGKIDTWFTDNTKKRFEAYHWHVIEINGHDNIEIANAIKEARAQTQKPTIIICNTQIGFGSLKEGTEHTHGSPLGADDIQQIRNKFNWQYQAFEIPEEIYAQWNHVEQGQADEQLWLQTCELYKKNDLNHYQEFLRRINSDLPDNWQNYSEEFIQKSLDNPKAIATRKASQACIEAYAKILPELLGGSADLTVSNNTDWSQTKPIQNNDFTGNYIYYGVREFGMSAIMNGIALHSGFIPYGGTFLVFTDYARNAVRLSALMGQRVIFVYTHDSIGLGEDGPTHQPIEHASMLRMTPNLRVWRPADLVETAVAWQQAIARHYGPSCLLLSRQNLPALKHTAEHNSLIKRGGYILQDSATEPQVILIATGSEVQIAVQAANKMQEKNVAVRVVSMPCAERFLKQDISYQQMVLPSHIEKRIAIEAAATAYWYKFVGLKGKVIGIDQYGASAPFQDVYQYAGITTTKTIEAIENLLIN